MPDPKPTIYAVSDATGELAISVSTAALRQFRQEGVAVLRRARTRTPDRIAKVVREVQENKGIVVFTLVSHDLREYLLRLATEAKIPAVDVMGPVMGELSRYFQKTPSDQPGLQYQVTNEYFRRNEAIEFSVKHDDGLGAETLGEAEIILLGVSRTSKTPLSIYLAYRGFKTANVPIIRDVPLSPIVRSLDRRKLVGLTISAEKLVELRESRLTRLGRGTSGGDYANPVSIRQELAYAERFFAELGTPVIDVTSKAIEEAASEVLAVLGR